MEELRALQSGEPVDEELWDMDRIKYDMAEISRNVAIDSALSIRLCHFISERRKGTPLGNVVSEVFRCADLRHFHMDMEARGLKRKIIMHVGPTNSGKTYNALRALASAESGYYAGPLRLLAQEIWERFNRGTIEPLIPDPTKSSNVVPCNLITGEDRREVSPDARLQSCTIEMLTLLQRFHVGVVDEIQMMADRDRGGSWTFALIASNVRELHLCGEETAVPLVRSMLKETGDDLTVKYYKRLTPMHVDTESLNGNWANVRKGDCVVTFSRDGIFALKRQIEAVTGLRCAVAYGRLPPEIRSEQAALFNDPDSGYDVMVASDAVGMGLNLYAPNLSSSATRPIHLLS